MTFSTTVWIPYAYFILTGRFPRGKSICYHLRLAFVVFASKLATSLSWVRCSAVLWPSRLDQPTLVLTTLAAATAVGLGDGRPLHQKIKILSLMCSFWRFSSVGFSVPVFLCCFFLPLKEKSPKPVLLVRWTLWAELCLRRAPQHKIILHFEFRKGRLSMSQVLYRILFISEGI